MVDTPPESLQEVESFDGCYSNDGTNDTVRAYTEPDPATDRWPQSWTPRQKQNWREQCAPVYSELETETGQLWFRRCYRPKKARTGYIRRQNVSRSNPEIYVCAQVEALLQGTEDYYTLEIYRAVVRRSTTTLETVETAVIDIVQAVAQTKYQGRFESLPEQTQQLVSTASEQDLDTISIH